MEKGYLVLIERGDVCLNSYGGTREQVLEGKRGLRGHTQFVLCSWNGDIEYTLFYLSLNSFTLL